jgi:hypothetical protein
MKKYNCTQNLSRHGQVVVSRLRMDYTRITQAYRLDNSPQPECQTCQKTLSVYGILFYGNAEASNLYGWGWNRPKKLADTVKNVYFSEERYEPGVVHKNIGLYNEI